MIIFTHVVTSPSRQQLQRQQAAATSAWRRLGHVGGKFETLAAEGT